MSAYPNGASRAAVRRAPVAPGQLPLFLDVLGVPYRPCEVMREPGDAARRIVDLRLPDGTAYQCADCCDWHECDCPTYLNSDDAGDCPHLQALVREGIFKPLTHAWTLDFYRKGGAR